MDNDNKKKLTASELESVTGGCEHDRETYWEVIGHDPDWTEATIMCSKCGETAHVHYN